MIKILNSYTQEQDEPGKAVQEILESLDIKNSLLKNTVALLFCHVRCIETGVMEAVIKSLPFDVLGCTSQYFGLPVIGGVSADAIESGIVLTVTIITSDDIDFSMGISRPLNKENVEDSIKELYRCADSSSSGLSAEPPVLVFAFPPTIASVSGDIMTKILNRACGGIPIFGSLALDIQNYTRQPKTIFKNSVESGAFSDRMVLLLFRGPLKPQFFSSFFPKESILSWDAVITKAEGNRIVSINNRPALSFIEDLGFSTNGIHESVMVFPLVIEYPYNNETNVVVLMDIDPDGQLICSMNVQAGGVLNIGAITADSVLESARTIAQELKKAWRGNGFIMFSCFLRNIVLGGSSQAEFESVRQELDGYSGSWLFLNSGGELCPDYKENGETVNQFHQYALIACQF